MKVFLKVEWRRGGRIFVWEGDDVPEIGHAPKSWPRSINCPFLTEAEYGEFRALVNSGKDSAVSASGRHRFMVFDVVERHGDYIIAQCSQLVRDRFPDHYRVVSLTNVSESSVEKHAMCHEIIRAARTKSLRGSFGLDPRP